jgi:hypothetical protein
MRVIAKSTLRKFWEKPEYSDAKGPEYDTINVETVNEY